MSIKANFAKLKTVSDMAWGQYAFSRDVVNNKIDDAQRREFIRRSYDCGAEEARRIKEEYGDLGPEMIAENMGMKLIEKTGGDTKERFMFGQFNMPNKISLYVDNIRKTEHMMFDREIDRSLDGVRLRDVIISHELFHSIELTDKTLYTSSVKIPLWRFLGYTHKSGIYALGEIAAMSFARELMDLTLNPFIFDVVLIYMKNDDRGNAATKKILAFDHKQLSE